MKTKISALILTAILATTLILTGCGDNNEPNLGEHGAKVYEPSLSAMSDDAIRIKIDELYDGIAGVNRESRITAYATKIAVLQNELIIRQLEALNAVDSPDKQPIQPHHKKQGLEGLSKKQGMKGFGKALKGLY